MRLSPNSEQASANALSFALLRDSFYQSSNAQRNTLAALENYVVRNLPQQRSCVVIGCRESFLAIHLAKFFPATVAVDESAANLDEITSQQPQVAVFQTEPDDFKLIGRMDLILVPHLFQSLGEWLETPEERNHQRLAFLSHYYGSLETGGMLVLLQNRPQNSYKQLLEYLNIASSGESSTLLEQINQHYSAEHSLFPIEVYTQRAEDMVQALNYLMSDAHNWNGTMMPLQTYVQTLLQLDGNYYFNYEREIIILRKKEV